VDKRYILLRRKNIIILSITCISFFGAGIIDMTYEDIIPLRPYSGLFIIGAALRKRHSGHSDYRPLRSSSQIENQINEPVEKYVERKKKAFKEKYSK